MVRIFRHYVSPVKFVLAIIDFIAIYVVAVSAEYIRYYFADISLDITLSGLLLKLIVPMIMVPVLLGFGAYESDSFRDQRIRYSRLTIALIISSMILISIIYLFPITHLFRSVFLLIIILSSFAVLVTHHLVLKIMGGGARLAIRLLIIGDNGAALAAKNYIQETPETGITVIGCHAFKDFQTQEKKPKSVLKSALVTYAQNHHISMILLADQHSASELFEDLLCCRLYGVEVRGLPDFYEQIKGYVDLETIDPEKLASVSGFGGGDLLARSLKRVVDLLIGVIFLCLALPVICMTAILVKATSRGPVFYLQERIGLYGKSFNLIKFRSMRVDAEASGTPQWASEKDPRVTAVGGFLRRSRIDEIPQVLNVLRGDMSFVGPRPERPYFVEQLVKDITYFNSRHLMKPGITGWAQVRYPYGASVDDAKCKLEHDLYYIKNYSLFLDFMVMLQTMRVILFPKGVR